MYPPVGHCQQHTIAWKSITDQIYNQIALLSCKQPEQNTNSLLQLASDGHATNEGNAVYT